MLRNTKDGNKSELLEEQKSCSCGMKGKPSGDRVGMRSKERAHVSSRIQSAI